MVAAVSKPVFVLVDGNGHLPVPVGETIRIKPSAGRMKIARLASDGKLVPVEHVVALAAPKDGGDLILLLDGHTRVVLDDFMKLCGNGSCDIELPDGKGGTIVIDGGSKAVSSGADGILLLHMAGDQSALSGLTESFARYYDVLAPHQADHAATAAVVTDEPRPFVLLGALAAGGGLVALAAGGGGGSSSHATPTPTPEPTPTPTPTPTPEPAMDDVVIQVAAGPITDALKYEIFALDGRLLASGLTDQSGRATAKVVASYAGPMTVQISDANGNLPDYLDEATAQAHPLSIVLRSIAMKTVELTSVTVSPLSEIVARLVGGVGLTAVNLDMIQTAVSNAFSINPANGITTIFDASYHEDDGIDDAEAYGQLLAVLSGADVKTGSMAATLDAITSGLTIHDGVATFSPEVQALLKAGAAIFESGPEKDRAVIIPVDVDLDPVTTISLSLQTLNGAPLDQLGHLGTLSGSSLDQAGQNIVARVGLPSNAVAGNTIRIQDRDATWATHTVTIDDVIAGHTDILIPTSLLRPLSGTFEIVATIGNDGQTTQQSQAPLTIDAVAPIQPTLALHSDSGVTNDNITLNGRIDVSGIENGASWQYSIDGGTNWHDGSGPYFTVTPGTYLANAVQVRQTDAAGNASSVASMPALSIVDAEPTVTITTDKAALKAGDVATITFSFSSPPLGFTLSDIEASYGIVSDLVATNDPKVFTATFTPTGSLADATTSIVIEVDSYTNVQGYSGLGGESQAIGIDTLAPPRPTATLSVDSGMDAADGITNNGQIVVTGVEQGAIAQYSLDGGLSWQNAQHDTAVHFSLSQGTFAAGAVRVRAIDVAGNASLEQAFGAISVDTTAPTVFITTDKGVLHIGETATLTLTFDSAVQELSLANLWASNGTLSNLTASPTNAGVYTVLYTPTEQAVATLDTITVNGFSDIAGNLGTATSSNPITLDMLAPSITNVEFIGDSEPQYAVLNTGDKVTIAVTFDQDVTIDLQGGVPEFGIRVGATLKAATYVGQLNLQTLLFDYTVQAGDDDADGLSFDGSSLVLNGGSIRDLAGNDALTLVSSSVLSAPQTLVYAVDTMAPVLVATTPSNGTQAGDASGLITLTFSEDVLSNGVITISDGGADIRAIPLNDPQVSISGSVVTILPSLPFTPGATYTVTMNQAALHDHAGNDYAGLGASQFTFTIPLPSQDVLLSDIANGNGGFQILSNGIFAHSSFGRSVSGLGDFNGDGVPDLVIGAADANAGYGDAYILSGSGLSGNIDLSGSYTGAHITGAGFNFGTSVAGLGDVNGDGFADVGISTANDGDGTFVIFGKSNLTSFNAADIINDIMNRGFLITNAYAASSAGDVNGDGRSDIIANASTAASDTGLTYVVFGQTGSTAIWTDALDDKGFIISGEANGDQTNKDVAGIGDINGDGIADLLIGAPNAGTYGAAYVIYGSTTGAVGKNSLISIVGTAGNDVLNDSGGLASIVAKAGDDFIAIGSSNSVVYAGLGNDQIIVTGDALQTLISPNTTSSRSMYINGGSGIDKLSIYANGNMLLHLDEMTGGSSAVSGDGRIEDVEIIDLGEGQGIHSFFMTEKDIASISHANVFRDDGRMQIMVQGGSEHYVFLNHLSGAPLQESSLFDYESNHYKVYTNDTVSIFIQQNISVVLPA